MDKNDAKTRSSYQKTINRLRETCIVFQKGIHCRNKYITQVNEFISAMIKEKKITKKDLKPYFKRKNERK